MAFASAKAKIERSRELIAEIDALISDTPPYTYILETNTHTDERATFAKSDQRVIDRLVVRCGEVFHNLRSSIDHAYFETVSPKVEDESKHGAIQFPFAKKEESLEQSVRSRMAHYVSEDFVQAICELKPFLGDGGNTLIFLIHEINIVDKHKFPTPIGDYTHISSEMIRAQIPDFPAGLVNAQFGQNRRDVGWTSLLYNPKDIGEIVPPTMNIFHKTLDVPVNVSFSIRDPYYFKSVQDSFNEMLEEVERVLTVMESFT